MEIIKKHLTRGQYLTEVFQKFSIFIHHSISTNAMSIWRWWNSTPSRVGTPYAIERDGKIYEFFDPTRWAYHLGVKGDDNWQEKHSINIELVSAGPLRLVEGEYRFYPLWPNKLRYTIIPEEEVIEFEEPYMGFKYWHGYTEAQLESLKYLVGKIALENPSITLDNDISKIFDYDPSVVEEHKTGIFTHTTVREDKSDAIPQPELIETLEYVQKEIKAVRDNIQVPEAKVEATTKKDSEKSTRRSRNKSSKKS